MSDALFTLGKFGKRARMMDLVENGTVFMQRLREFREAKDVARRDQNEGALMRVDARAPGTWMNINIGTTRIPIQNGSVQFHGAQQEHAVYCMYSFLEQEGGPLPDDLRTPLTGLPERLPEFGDTLVLFVNTAEFVRRLRSAARNAGYELEHGRVEYVPQHHSGAMGPFRKLETFSHQSEWRCITDKPIPNASLTLKLGNLRDIALVYELSYNTATRA
jgi:hypothetical protein